MDDGDAVSTRTLPAGWGWPGNSRKAHYFEADNSASVCHRWMFGGQRQPEGFKSPDDCAACRRWVDRNVKTDSFDEGAP